jgi:prevent-host-death family protein
MDVYSIRQAKRDFSLLVKRAAAGETILIGKPGKILAKLVPVAETTRPPNRIGLMKGKIKMAEDFDV